MRKSFVQKVANSFIRSKSSRTTAEVSAGLSASVADTSQSTHSAATSRNLRDLSVRLDDYLEQVALTGDEVDLDVILMSRQIEKVRNYSNGHLPDSVQPYALSDSDLALIKLAAWSAKDAYVSDTAHAERIAQIETFSKYRRTQFSDTINASFRDGTVKATKLHLFSGDRGKSPRLLVIAIRGSTSKRRDWTINFDDIGAGTNGDGFIDTTDSQYQIHGGFLECAKGVVEKVSDAISSILSKAEAEENSNGDIQLLFTGHSAGGAVASLLYAHMISGNPSSLAGLHSRFTSINCIVFGSPPVSKPELTTYGRDSTFLSIINEGDPVPRMDKEYIASLLIVYLSPMPVTPNYWELPAMLLDNAGTILLMKDGEEGLCAVGDDIGQKRIRNVLETTLFGNPRAHKMDMYLLKLGLLGGLP
ncbi:Alpha/Beta hydrolase protein [Aspergillus varians]